MKLESQVCSLELARELKSLGVKQENEFYWVEVNGARELWSKHIREIFDAANKDIVMAHRQYFSAFTVAELGEMLPIFYKNGDVVSPVLEIRKHEAGWSAGYEFSFYADTEADARAKMLIYLLESKLVTL